MLRLIHLAMMALISGAHAVHILRGYGEESRPSPRNNVSNIHKSTSPYRPSGDLGDRKAFIRGRRSACAASKQRVRSALMCSRRKKATEVSRRRL